MTERSDPRTRLTLRQLEVFVAIARGGMIPAALIARELEIRLLDTICASSYDESEESGAQNTRSDVKILKGVDHDGEGFLLID